MKKYTGTKEVNAKPMTRLEYNNLRGWALPSDENGFDKGFLVEYIDGGTPNTKLFSGYISWSPEEVFNKSYKPSETPLERVKNERNELAVKISKLREFIGREDIDEIIDIKHKRILKMQCRYMTQYRKTLDIQIKLMKKK